MSSTLVSYDARPSFPSKFSRSKQKTTRLSRLRRTQRGGDFKRCTFSQNLFAFGDVDGKARNVKLQHPLGVAWDSRRGRLYVADSYNHKVKVVDPDKKTCYTLLSPDPVEMPDHLRTQYPVGFGPVTLNEPGGLSVDPENDVLYVADTNNHRIVTVDLARGVISELNVRPRDKTKGHDQMDAVPAGPPVYKPLAAKSRAVCRTLDPVEVSANQTLRIEFKVHDLHLTADAPSSWQASLHFVGETNPTSPLLLSTGGFRDDQPPRCDVTIPLRDLAPVALLESGGGGGDEEVGQVRVEVVFESNLYYCAEGGGTCTMTPVRCELPVALLPPRGARGEIVVEMLFSADDFAR